MLTQDYAEMGRSQHDVDVLNKSFENIISDLDSNLVWDAVGQQVAMKKKIEGEEEWEDVDSAEVTTKKIEGEEEWEDVDSDEVPEQDVAEDRKDGKVIWPRDCKGITDFVSKSSAEATEFEKRSGKREDRPSLVRPKFHQLSISLRQGNSSFAFALYVHYAKSSCSL